MCTCSALKQRKYEQSRTEKEIFSSNFSRKNLSPSIFQSSPLFRPCLSPLPPVSSLSIILPPFLSLLSRLLSNKCFFSSNIAIRMYIDDECKQSKCPAKRHLATSPVSISTRFRHHIVLNSTAAHRKTWTKHCSFPRIQCPVLRSVGRSITVESTHLALTTLPPKNRPSNSLTAFQAPTRPLKATNTRTASDGSSTGCWSACTKQRSTLKYRI
jgi:hypothetical protein